MKRTLMIFGMLMAMAFVCLSVSAQDRHGRDDRRQGQDIGRMPAGRNVGTWHKRNVRGYRNYGQYRRTQVGNRRWRMARRYYQSDRYDRSRSSRRIRINN